MMVSWWIVSVFLRCSEKTNENNYIYVLLPNKVSLLFLITCDKL